MSSTSAARSPVTRSRRAIVLTALIALLVSMVPGVASAHGSASDPPSRLYNCFHNTDRFDPDLATTNPMCAQAWAAEPQALYDWPGLLTTEGDTPYEDFVPNGEICSAGLDKYAAFDEPGDWDATEVDNTFTLTWTSTAPHETEFYRIYVTRQGFDPTSDELSWADLDLVEDSGQLPAAPEDVFEVSAPGRTGHHIVYIQWRRLPGHSPETFYSCSDVIFPGGDGSGGGAEAPSEPVSDESDPEAPAPEEPGEAVSEITDDADDAPADPAPAEEPAPEEAPAEPTPVDDGGADSGSFAGILELLLALLQSLSGLFG